MVAPAPQVINPPKKTRTFMLSVFPYASQPPVVKEVFNVSDIVTDMPNVRQFLINMPPIGEGPATIKEIY